jgi:hypothetical protein
MWQDLLTAVSLYLIIEGMIPFVGPKFFRQAALKLADLTDNNLRVSGLTVMAAGLLLLYIVRQ